MWELGWRRWFGVDGRGETRTCCTLVDARPGRPQVVHDALSTRPPPTSAETSATVMRSQSGVAFSARLKDRARSALRFCKGGTVEGVVEASHI